jgi:hypothetical protein
VNDVDWLKLLLLAYVTAMNITIHCCKVQWTGTGRTKARSNLARAHTVGVCIWQARRNVVGHEMAVDVIDRRCLCRVKGLSFVIRFQKERESSRMRIHALEWDILVFNQTTNTMPYLFLLLLLKGRCICFRYRRL